MNRKRKKTKTFKLYNSNFIKVKYLPIYFKKVLQIKNKCIVTAFIL